jgi:hypothetical protein
MPDNPSVKRGTVPIFRIGGFDLRQMPALQGMDTGDLTAGLDVDLAGIVGADLLAFFRVTVADDGRFIWIEPDPALVAAEAPAAPPRGADGVRPPSSASSAAPPQPPTAAPASSSR